MFKQLGLSSVELLISLSIMSSVAAYTIEMATEVEKSVDTYQKQINVKDALKKINSKKSNDSN